MKKELIIFGTGKISEVISYYAEKECGYKIAAFTVDKKFVTAGHLGKPVVAFEDIEKNFAPSEYEMFVALGYQDLNRLRERKCDEAIAKQYKLVSLVSKHLPIPENVSIGYNCFLMPQSLVHPCVTIGNNVFIWSGAMVGHHSHIGDNCWLTSCCNVSGNTRLGKNCFLAVNATIGHNVKMGDYCFAGANSLVIKDLESEKVVIAEPSKPIRLNSSQFLRLSNISLD